MRFISRLVCFVFWLGVVARAAIGQEACMSLDAAIVAAEATKAQGAQVALLDGPRAAKALRMVTDAVGPPPRPLSLTGAILMVTPTGGVLALIEHTQVCLVANLGSAISGAIWEAVEGRAI
jgi:hypothetical protein